MAWRAGAATPLAELATDRWSYVDPQVASGRHTYQLVLRDAFGHLTAAVTASVTVGVATQPLTTLDFRVLTPSGEALAAQGRVGQRLLLQAESTPPAASTFFEYSADGQAWNAVGGDLACALTCSLDWNLSGLAVGHCQVRAGAESTGGIVTSRPQTFVVAPSPPVAAPTMAI